MLIWGINDSNFDSAHKFDVNWYINEMPATLFRHGE